MTSPLIGLIGKKRSGKDTVAATLVKELGYTRIAFADPLREVALALDPIIDQIDVDNSCGDPDCCGGPYPTLVDRRLSDIVWAVGWEKAKDDFPEIRRTLQNLGVAIRALDPDFWLRIGVERIEAVGGPVVVTDARFPNEAEAIVDLGGDVVRVLRPSVVSTDMHASETSLDEYPEDLVILNDGSLIDLASSAHTAHIFASCD